MNLQRRAHSVSHIDRCAPDEVAARLSRPRVAHEYLREHTGRATPSVGSAALLAGRHVRTTAQSNLPDMRSRSHEISVEITRRQRHVSLAPFGVGSLASVHSGVEVCTVHRSFQTMLLCFSAEWTSVNRYIIPDHALSFTLPTVI